MKLKNIIKRITNIDIDKVSRRREVVRARKVYYKTLRQTSKISCIAMANSVNQDHATALHALKNFDFEYKTDAVLKEIYDNVYDVFARGKKIKTLDDIIKENLVMQDKIIELKSQVKELRSELKKARSNNIRPRNQQTTIYASSEVVEAF